MKLDKIDITILEMLKKDARTSFREIARKLDVSPDTISNRFERLKEQGIIINSTVIINPTKIGYSFIARFGIDIFMTTLAVAENFKVCQAYLGSKIHDPKDPRGLGPMFTQVSSTIFSLMKTYENVWKENFDP